MKELSKNLILEQLELDEMNDYPISIYQNRIRDLKGNK